MRTLPEEANFARFLSDGVLDDDNSSIIPDHCTAVSDPDIKIKINECMLVNVEFLILIWNFEFLLILP